MTFFRLYEMPSFRSGVARILDIGATYTRYNTSPSPAEADLRALTDDLAVVGNYFDPGPSTVIHVEKK